MQNDRIISAPRVDFVGHAPKLDKRAQSFGNGFEIIPEGDTIIMHYAFCIMHWIKGATYVF